MFTKVGTFLSSCSSEELCCSANQQGLDRFLKLVVRSYNRLAAIAVPTIVITHFFHTFPTSAYSEGKSISRAWARHSSKLGSSLLQHQMKFKFPRKKQCVTICFNTNFIVYDRISLVPVSNLHLSNLLKTKLFMANDNNKSWIWGSFLIRESSWYYMLNWISALLQRILFALI